MKIENTEICFDPAKIRNKDLKHITPDVIFVSHESMDHMDPIQVYTLQKKKKCKVFCSIAAAVDLTQYFAQDIEFVDSIQALIPGCDVIYKNVLISTAKSVHCDYMLPLVIKICFLDQNISMIHCFDSHLSDEIIQLSIGTDLGIIPIGIAKGASPSTGQEFVKKLHCKTFITNHFKDEKHLQEFNSLIKDNCNENKFLLLDWNQTSEITINPKFQSTLQNEMINLQKTDIDEFHEILLTSKELSIQHLKTFIIRLNEQKSKLLDKEMLKKIFFSYSAADEETKKVLLIIYTLVSLIDPNVITQELILNLKKDIVTKSSAEINNLKVTVLFFLGIYAQQIGKCHYLEIINDIAKNESEHVNYWVVEFLGRSATSKGNNYQKAFEDLSRIIQNKDLYNSVVVRRKIFWELFRIAKALPHLSSQFFSTFEAGLSDSNPDVRLLAILCFGLANRIHLFHQKQIFKIFELFNDPEDDVRETAVKIIGMISKNYQECILKNKNKINALLVDKNCHVQFAAEEALSSLN